MEAVLIEGLVPELLQHLGTLFRIFLVFDIVYALGQPLIGVQLV